MGYESRLFVVEKSTTSIFEKEKRYGEVIAVVNMCQLGNGFAKRFLGGKYRPTDCYIYYNCERLTEDRYGKPLIEIPLKDLIEYFEIAEEEDGHYRRHAPVLNLLKGFDRNEWGDLVVLHYGY